MPFSTPFSRLARQWRAASKLSQTDAALLMRVNQGTISCIELGRRRASVAVLERMREVYGLTDRDVVEGVSAMAGGPALAADDGAAATSPPT